MPGVVVVFEVLSQMSGRTDRIDKLREYHAVASIRRYVILEHTSVGLIVFERAKTENAWKATALTADDTLLMPEIGIEVPVTEFYENSDLPLNAVQDATKGDNSQRRFNTNCRNHLLTGRGLGIAAIFRFAAHGMARAETGDGGGGQDHPDRAYGVGSAWLCSKEQR